VIPPAFAQPSESVQRDVAEVIASANALMRGGDARRALDEYARARAARPEDPALIFNEACARLRTGEIDAARTLFAEASQRGATGIGAKARFNIGHLAFTRGAEVAQSDPHGAIEHFRDAAEAFQASYDLKPDPQAAQNVELARLAIKRMRDRIEEEQQQEEQQRQQQQDLAQQLQDLAQRQQELSDRSAQAEQQLQEDPEAARDELERIQKDQDQLNEETRDALEQARQFAEQRQTTETARAVGRLETATDRQQDASEMLAHPDPGQAKDEQARAAQLIKDASDLLNTDAQQQQQQDEQQQEGEPKDDQPSEQPQQEGESPQTDQEAEDLLEKERQEREARQVRIRASSGQNKPVEKDW
jgi:Ca-activated chloride channel family protein